jgi:hypothetical protein
MVPRSGVGADHGETQAQSQAEWRDSPGEKGKGAAQAAPGDHNAFTNLDKELPADVKVSSALCTT